MFGWLHPYGMQRFLERHCFLPSDAFLRNAKPHITENHMITEKYLSIILQKPQQKSQLILAKCIRQKQETNSAFARYSLYFHNAE